MPTLDDRLRRELREATPTRDPETVYRHLAERRLRNERRRAVGRIGLTVVVLAAVVGAVIVVAESEDAAIVPLPPRPADTATVVTKPHRIAGVPFDVCRSVSIPMSFDGGREGHAYVVEEPHGNADSCEDDGGEGFQRLAVTPDGGAVVALSERLGECPDATGCWPAATPDLDGDGTDEIALGVGWRPDGSSQVVFYAFSREEALMRVELRCDRNGKCPSPWVMSVSARPESAAAITCRQGDASPVLETYDRSVQGGTVATYVVGSDPLVLIPVHSSGDVDAPPWITGDQWHETDAAAATVCRAPFLDLGEADPLMAEYVIDLLNQPIGEAVAPELQLCNVEQLGGLWMGPDIPLATAWTGHRVVNDRCRDAYDAPGIVAVDVDGDGSADGWTETEWCSDGCQPLAGTDLNADGRDELVVLLQWSSTPVFGLFEVVPFGEARSPGVYPIFVAPPGHPAAGFEPGEPFRLRGGGDEGFAAAFRCEGDPAAPVIVAATSDHVVDSPDPARITLTRFRLGDDGAMHVLEAQGYEATVGQGLPIEQEQRACGVRWGL